MAPLLLFGLMRIALGVEYDGRNFHGWQLQKGDVRTVQGELERALTRVANHPVRLFCAGRTDTGVHGIGQVAHFDSDADRSERNWLLGSNVNLPADINIRWVKKVEDSFHARFSAIGRTYRYLILNRPDRSALMAGRATWVRSPLNSQSMLVAARSLLGKQDFSSYRAVGCQAKSPVRTIESLHLDRQGDFIVMSVSADGFLHHMVRNIAGVLIAIGKGEKPEEWAGEVLAMRDRTCGGITAPADGLYFEQVRYPGHFDLPEPAKDVYLFS